MNKNYRGYNERLAFEYHKKRYGYHTFYIHNYEEYVRLRPIMNSKLVAHKKVIPATMVAKYEVKYLLEYRKEYNETYERPSRSKDDKTILKYSPAIKSRSKYARRTMSKLK